MSDGEWPPEEIPNAHTIFLRVHRSFIGPDGAPTPGAIKDHGGGMSTNWAKYCDAQAARQRAKTPRDNGVLSFNVGTVRSSPQTVEHTPTADDRSHTDVFGEKTAAIRLRLLESFNWAIQLNDPL
ncbi:MAG TPA: hypothetical protein VF331_13945 [Polyangiales bacterium]